NGAQRGEGTRPAIRQCGSMKMSVAVVGRRGEVLGVVRTLDAPIFGFDVSVQKARTALAFSDPNNALGQQIRGVLGIPQGAPLAVSARAVGFLSQIHYPPAVEGSPPGPFGRDPNDPNSMTLQQQLSTTCAPSGNGITIFPGGLPLYKNGVLVGAIGVSGDGINQDEIVAESGTVGFEAPAAIRTDTVDFQGTTLPYLKEPRNPGRF
ncbi:MAG: GlcG/HbpS family heme-binding protein, partial [Candidatus Binatia bacterium]